MHVLMITSEWPSTERPNSAPFVRRQVEALRRLGVEVDVFHFRGARNPFNYLAAWRNVRRRLADGPYDLVHAQWGQSALPALPKRLPLVVTFRGSDLQGILGRSGGYSVSGVLLRAISKWVSRISDQVIIVSERLAPYLTKREYHVIPSGIDLDSFRPKPEAEARSLLGLPLDKRLVLFAADPTRRVKRFELAQAAVQRLKARFDAQLVVAKDVQHTSMPDYMNACDVLLLTSAHEGSPNVVKEALACNLPVVSVDVGDVRLRVAAVEGCVVCDDHSPESIADGLARALSAARPIDGRSAVSELDEQLLARKVLSVYEQAAFSGRNMPITMQSRDVQKITGQEEGFYPRPDSERMKEHTCIPILSQRG